MRRDTKAVTEKRALVMDCNIYVAAHDEEQLDADPTGIDHRERKIHQERIADAQVSAEHERDCKRAQQLNVHILAGVTPSFAAICQPRHILTRGLAPLRRGRLRRRLHIYGRRNGGRAGLGLVGTCKPLAETEKPRFVRGFQRAAQSVDLLIVAQIVRTFDHLGERRDPGAVLDAQDDIIDAALLQNIAVHEAVYVTGHYGLRVALLADGRHVERCR